MTLWDHQKDFAPHQDAEDNKGLDRDRFNRLEIVQEEMIERKKYYLKQYLENLLAVIFVGILWNMIYIIINVWWDWKIQHLTDLAIVKNMTTSNFKIKNFVLWMRPRHGGGGTDKARWVHPLLIVPELNSKNWILTLKLLNTHRVFRCFPVLHGLGNIVSPVVYDSSCFAAVCGYGAQILQHAHENFWDPSVIFFLSVFLSGYPSNYYEG